MNTTEEKLFNLASSARENAYAPYSRFKVGAAIMSTTGNCYAGCNVENVSYPCGTCAEAGAVAAMICNGDKTISQILIIADAPQLITPCGACLQRIREFSSPETVILLADLSGIRERLNIAELLPRNFDNQELKK